MVGYLRVEVADTGVGIALENQENVFGEFSQFNRNKLQGGGDDYYYYYEVHVR